MAFQQTSNTEDARRRNNEVDRGPDTRATGIEYRPIIHKLQAEAYKENNDNNGQ